MNSNLYETVLTVLKTDDRFFSHNGELLRNAVYEAALQMDNNLIKILLSNPITKDRFFSNVEGILVFDKISFGWVVNNREFLPDSYTRYKNKIGLTNGRGEYISSSNDVELVFPYKDCVLEGGQTKEDQKRSEIFYNETLVPDEVDRLLYPKVFTNAKCFTKDGVELAKEYQDTDNLIIKGNNLLALASLLKRYEGKIKCIYIDPPYYFSANRDEDTFAYNSNFKLSTWLVFMRNRLETAKKLLREDGAIFVQISDDGVAELHCLLKEIFITNGENNFINKITVKTKSPSGFASVNAGVFETAEYILAFAKNKKMWTYNPQHVKSDYDENYKWYIPNISDNYSDWKIVDLFEHIANEQGYTTKLEAIKNVNPAVFNQLVAEFALKNAQQVFRYTAIGNNAGQDIVYTRDQSKINKGKIYKVQRDKQYDVYITNGQEIAFYSKKIREIDGELTPSIQLSNIWTDTPYEGIANEGGVTLKGGKKPEKLLKRIIEMSTNEGDIVLDFHLGSGTTCAVAHKLNRQYIGVEQLDYKDNDSITRLQNVIAGDQSGISKAVNWKGGGSFVYCELKKLNQEYADLIQTAKDDKELASVWQKIKETGFISSYVNPKEIEPEVEDFNALDFEDKKRLLIALLDKNLLYVNLCDMEDEDFAISNEDKAFTKSFYKEG